MGWRGQSFNNIQLLYPNSPIVSLAENRKDFMVVVLISVIVKFSLIIHIEVFLPHLFPLEPFSPDFSGFLFFPLAFMRALTTNNYLPPPSFD